ncbi:MAG: DUF4870 domain-containing protein [Candidatus Pacearchaeota archaeon]|nr:DUF4870 domain-containing protein [Candidatus Pacearchaeota archaeon]
MAKQKKTKEVAPKKESKSSADDSKTYAFLATFLSIVGFIIAFIIALVTKKDDKYVMHYAKQSLVLFIAWIIVGVVSMVLRLIPIVGGIISWLLYALMIILWILSWVYALSGKIQYIPVIGQFGDKFNL